MDKLNQGFTIFLSLLVEAMPFLLLGVLFSSVLLLFVDEKQLIRWMPKNPILGALAGSSIGFLFPVCECGNVPVARRLLTQGIPPAVAIGFLLAAPTVNPIVIWSTWTAFRDQPQMVVLRVVFSLAIATAIGAIFSVQSDPRPLLQSALARSIPTARSRMQQSPSTPTLLQSGTYLLGRSGGQAVAMEPMVAVVPPSVNRWHQLGNTMLREMRELGGVLVVGSAIAAAIQVAVPRDLILSLGQNPVSSVVAMLALAAVVSICSTVDAFFALSFASAFTSGSLLAFLVFGPMVDLKGIGLMLSIFRGRAVLYLFVLAGQMTFLLSLLVNLYGS